MNVILNQFTITLMGAADCSGLYLGNVCEKHACMFIIGTMQSGSRQLVLYLVRDLWPFNSFIVKEVVNYLQLHEILGTIISKFIRSLCPLEVSTNNSSDTFGDIYVCNSDKKSRIITIAPETVTKSKTWKVIYKQNGLHIECNKDRSNLIYQLPL